MELKTNHLPIYLIDTFDKLSTETKISELAVEYCETTLAQIVDIHRSPWQPLVVSSVATQRRPSSYTRTSSCILSR